MAPFSNERQEIQRVGFNPRETIRDVYGSTVYNEFTPQEQAEVDHAVRQSFETGRQYMPHIQMPTMMAPDPRNRQGRDENTDFNLLGVAGRFMTGIAHGFTGINMNRTEVNNSAEGIAQSLGTWLGITGMFFKLPVSLGARFLTRGAAAGMKMTGGFSSVPMAVGDATVRGMRNVAQNYASPQARQFLHRHRIGLDSAEGALRIGTAMGSLSWQEGINGMLQGAAFGAFFGGSDRLIGNTIRGMRPQLQRLAKSGDPNSLRKVERTVSAISAGIVSGMPSTLMGQPWEYQVYDYLFGAWLGAEPSFAHRRTSQFLNQVRGRGEELNLMSTKSREAYEPYKEFIARYPSKKLQDQLKSEVQSQVDYRYGQMTAASDITRATQLMAIAARSGDPNMYSTTMNEIIDGRFVQDSYDAKKQQALKDGMDENAANEVAMEHAREEYVLWKKGEMDPNESVVLSDFLQTWNQDQADMKLYTPLKVGETVGVATKVNDKGQVVEITAADGAKLVYPKNNRGVVATAEQLTAQRANLRENYTSITRAEFVDMVASSQVDDTAAEIPIQLWNMFPDVKESNEMIMVRQAEDGTYEGIIRYGKDETVAGTHDTQEGAYRMAINRVFQEGMHLKRMQDPNILNTDEALNQLATLSEDLNTTVSSRPLFDLIREISNEHARANDLDPTSRALYPIQVHKKISQMAESTFGRNTAEMAKLQREMIKAERANDQVRYAEAMKQMSQLRDSYGYKQGWKGFLQKMNEMYPGPKYDMSNQQIRDIRRWYRRMEIEKPVKQLVIKTNEYDSLDQSGRKVKRRDHTLTNEYGDTLPGGKRLGKQRAPSFLDRTISRLLGTDDPEVIHISDSVITGGDRPQTGKLTDTQADLTDPATIHKMNMDLGRMYRQGELERPYFILSGVKDKDTLRAVPYLFQTNARAQEYLSKRIDALDKIKPGFRKSYEAQKADAQDAQMFDMQYATTMRMWEGLNNDVTGKFDTPIEFLASNSNFLSSVSAMNKRMQIMDADGVLADPEFYTITGEDGTEQPRMSLKALIVNTVNKDGSSQVEGVPDILMQNSDGSTRAGEEYRDGSVIMSQREFDQMLMDGGIEGSSSAIKGVTAFADKHGMMLGKYAIFRATDSVNEFMNTNNTQLLYYTSTTKQLGDRKAYDMQITKDGRTVFRDGEAEVNPQQYDIPIQGLTINAGTSENIASSMKRQKLGVQVLQSLSDHLVDSNVSRETINEVINTAMVTSDANKKILAEIEALAMIDLDAPVNQAALDTLREKVKSITVDDLSPADVMGILNGDHAYVKTGLYGQIIKDLHGRHKEEGTNTDRDDIAMGMDVDAGMEYLAHQHATDLDVILTSMESHMLTPEVINSRDLHAYVNSIYRKQMYRRIFTPRMDYSAKSIASQQDAWYLNENGPVQEGTFVMGQAARNMKVKVEGKDTTLGEAWNMRQQVQREIAEKQKIMKKLKGKKKKEDLENQIKELQNRAESIDEGMTMVIARVPIEHASGVRPMRFVGFSGERGMTSKFNPNDMAYLGGMDLDIDSVFIYQNLGKTKHTAKDGTKKSLIDELSRPDISRHWNRKIEGTDKEGFLDPKSKEMREVWKAKEDTSRDYANMFNPASMMQGSRAAATANKSLGIIVNARKDLLALTSRVEKERIYKRDLSEGAQKRFEKVFGPNKTYVVMQKRQGAEQRIDEVARAGINLSADASDLTTFIRPNEILSTMHKQAYELVDTGEGVAYKSMVDFLHGQSKAHRLLRESTQAIHGRAGEQTNLDLNMVVSQLNFLNNQFNEHSRTGMLLANDPNGIPYKNGIGLQDFTGSWYTSMSTMMKLPNNFDQFSYLNESNLQAFHDVFNQIVSPADKIGELVNQIFFRPGSNLSRKVELGATKEKIAEYGEVLKQFKTGEKSIADVKTAHDKVTDFISRNFMEMASVANVYREASRLMLGKQTVRVGKNDVAVDIPMIHQIFVKVNNLKNNFFHIKGVGDKAIIAKKQYPFRTKEAIAGEYNRIKNSYDPKLHKLIDMMGIGNVMWSQVPSVQTTDNPFLHNAHPNHVRDFYNIYSAFRRAEFTTEGKESRQRLLEYFDDANDPTSLLYRTIPYSLEPRSRLDLKVDTIVKKDKARRQKLKDEGKDPDEPTTTYTTEENTNILNDDSLPVGSRFDAAYRNVLHRIEKAGEANIKLSSEEQVLVQELRTLFSRYPQLRDNFDMIFEGVQAYDLNEGVSRSWDMATMQDLRNFINVAKSAKHGNLLGNRRGSSMEQLPWYMVWTAPDRYHKEYAADDLLFSKKKARVLTRDGVKDKDVMVFSSMPENLRSWSNKIQLAMEVRRDQISNRMLSEIEPLSSQIGENFETVWKYAVHNREVHSQRYNTDYTVKERDRLQKELIDNNETFVIDGKEMDYVQAADLVSQKITELNQQMWDQFIHSKFDENIRFEDDDRTVIDTKHAVDLIRKQLDGQDVNPELPGIQMLNRLAAQLRAENSVDARKLERYGNDWWLYIRGTTKTIMDAGKLNLQPIDFAHYYPHRDYTKKQQKEIALKEFSKRKDVPQIEGNSMREQDDLSIKAGERDVFLDDGAPIKDVTAGMAGNLYSRSMDVESIMPGWNSGVNAYFNYMGDMMKTQMNKSLAIVGNAEIRAWEGRMDVKNWGNQKPWADFMRMYLSDQVQTTTVIPESLAMYKDSYINRSKYKYFTDQYYLALDNKISKALGTEPLLADNNPRRSLRLAEISNMEAKYSLLSLLSRPKAFVTNMYGGATLLAADIGIGKATRAFSLDSIKKVNPDIKSMDDALRFAEQQGAMESIIRNEVMEQAVWNNKSIRSGLEKLLADIKADPAMDDTTLFEKAKQHGISDKVMNAAAWPMRKSERILRTRSFLAHYINAMDALGSNIATNPEHPWALEMARRGVATSQFLYNNANRPAVARSNVGKIFARFKLWAFNSVKVRFDAYNDFVVSSGEDYNPGFDRFNRMMMTDMFMLALASLYPFHVMGNSIPEPYGWMNDLVSWAFGDPDEKRGAFRQGAGLPTAIAPLAVALPPSSRMLTGWIDPVMKGEMDDYMGYQMWSHFPFGLLARDVKNAVNRPEMAIDRMTGIPVGEILSQ